MHTPSNRIFSGPKGIYFQYRAFWRKSFHVLMHKGTRQKSLWVSNFTLLKVVWVSNFTHLKVVFKWYHGSEGVKYVYIYICQTNIVNLTKHKTRENPTTNRENFHSVVASMAREPVVREQTDDIVSRQRSILVTNERQVISFLSLFSCKRTKCLSVCCLKKANRRNNNFVSNVSTLKKRQTFFMCTS